MPSDQISCVPTRQDEAHFVGLDNVSQVENRADLVRLEKRRAQGRAKTAKFLSNEENRERACASTRRWSAKNRDKIKKYRAEYHTKPINRMRRTLGQAKRRASESGRVFSITIEDILPLPDICPVLGIQLNYSGTQGKRGFVENSPSIDRIDSSLGYVKGNVRVISWRANRLKADASLEELRLLLAYMERESV